MPGTRAESSAEGRGDGLRVAIVAGEASGDLLGASLMQALKARVPDIRFEGAGGPRMEAQGCHCLVAAEELAVMGLVEVLKHLPRLFGIRARLREHFKAAPPDVFIGIDLPDFNLRLEGDLKSAGIPTIHYVSPSVWAWRQGRVKTIARSVDRILTLFPFEERFYREHDVPVRFVGHPLADDIPMETDPVQARTALGLPRDRQWIALLPGSRRGELRYLAEIFARTVNLIHEQRPDIGFVAPMATEATRSLFEQALAEHAPHVDVTLFDGRAHEAMAASDAVLVTSGTATLEALLLKRPMVVTYNMQPFSYWLLTGTGLLKIRRYSLPNLLAGRELVPELIQDDARPEELATQLLRLLQDGDARRAQTDAFATIHGMLRQGASDSAAEAVLELIREREDTGV